MAKLPIEPSTITGHRDFECFVEILEKVKGQVPIKVACEGRNFNRSRFYRWTEALLPEEAKATNRPPLSASSLAEAVLNALGVSNSIVHDPASPTATN